jgi:hypothetical protein
VPSCPPAEAVTVGEVMRCFAWSFLVGGAHRPPAVNQYCQIPLQLHCAGARGGMLQSDRLCGIHERAEHGGPLLQSLLGVVALAAVSIAAYHTKRNPPPLAPPGAVSGIQSQSIPSERPVECNQRNTANRTRETAGSSVRRCRRSVSGLDPACWAVVPLPSIASSTRAPYK